MGVEGDGLSRRHTGVEDADELVFEEVGVVVRGGGEGVQVLCMLLEIGHGAL